MRRSFIAIVATLLGACSGPADGVDAAAGGADAARPGLDAATGVDSGPSMGLDGSVIADGGFDAGGPTMGCTYPADAVEPMAMDRPLWAYRWPTSRAGDGTSFPLDLEQVFCNTDPNRDWSGFDLLLVISVPDW